ISFGAASTRRWKSAIANLAPVVPTAPNAVLSPADATSASSAGQSPKSIVPEESPPLPVGALSLAVLPAGADPVLPVGAAPVLPAGAPPVAPPPPPVDPVG